MPMSYSPVTGLVYIPAMETTAVLAKAEPFEIHPGRWNIGVSFQGPPPEPKGAEAREARPRIEARAPGKLIAWDPVAQQARWTVERDWSWNGGTLATAGNLVFQGTAHGEFEAYSADTGKKLWSFQTHRGIMAGPVTYRVQGEQYVAVMAGYGGASGVSGTPPFMKDKAPAGMIVAFKLNGKATLPPHIPTPLNRPSPSAEQFGADQIAAGRRLYFTYCSICHGGPANPVLQRSPLIADRDAFHQVVIGGALARNGMASFADYLQAQDAEGIRAFLNEQARDLVAAEVNR
jgi:mono/diheme cytochrome c family protein